MRQKNYQPRKRSRAKMIEILENTYPNLFVSITEEFDGAEGGIWISGEDGTTDKNGRELFNYWTEDHENYTFGVVNHLNRWANRAGWMFSWNDAGTIMMWED